MNFNLQIEPFELETAPVAAKKPATTMRGAPPPPLGRASQSQAGATDDQSYSTEAYVSPTSGVPSVFTATVSGKFLQEHGYYNLEFALNIPTGKLARIEFLTFHSELHAPQEIPLLSLRTWLGSGHIDHYLQLERRQLTKAVAIFAASVPMQVHASPGRMVHVGFGRVNAPTQAGYIGKFACTISGRFVDL